MTTSEGKPRRLKAPFAESTSAMKFSATKSMRFIKNLEKHGVLADFIRLSKADPEATLTFSKNSLNLMKKLLQEKGADKVDVFSKSIVGDPKKKSKSKKECPHWEG
ncbi:MULTISPECIES: hypothetical protein [unclassified Mesorhizobium]|uniref:hypothetical protein n=1 Tax=unclassified Mesorhizobium TaxID=325217 RepID=UPI000FCB98F9|nr:MULTISPECIES: hypothetical protein [unclassified Mesorhizobium]RUX96187.1 hypothetical protein EN993_08740 [Mesorhizobium sp. M7D.F.Ca.US.004.01.2.1]RVA29927.1 hypothetical protein EN935_15980 [Mesorhizobium sp. M7D.F.Ca.US.004.03.1.1]